MMYEYDMCKPDALLYGVASVVLQISVELLQLEGGLLRRRLDPLCVESWHAVDHACDCIRQDGRTASKI